MAKQSHQLSSMAAASMALDDLSNWELVDVEDDEYDAVFDVQSIDSLSSFSSSEADSDLDQEQDKDEDQAAGPRNYLDAVMGSSPPPPIPDAIVCVRTINLSPNFDDGRDKKVADHTNYDDVDDDDEVDDDDVDDDDGYGIDDELVPWEVKNRFERQRMRKLGKRAFAKMGKSKSSGLLYTKRGCVRGKHGLGLKAF